MFRNRQRVFGRKTRRRIARVTLLLALAFAGSFAGRAIQGELSPRLTFSPTTTAYAADSSAAAVKASINARVNRDLPLLEDLWSVGGGPGFRVSYVEAPRGIRAGLPLRVAVHADRPDGRPVVGAVVEVSWQLGGARYRDVTYTDVRGTVNVSREVDKDARGKPCVVAVRLYKAGLLSMAYTTFTPR
jgi:hypothetical protein